MSDTVKETKVARRVRRIVDVKIIVEPPDYIGRWIGGYGSEEYWKKMAEKYQSWVNEFNEFLRDHRSQDQNIMTVEEDIQDVCDQCGEPWETIPENEDGPEFCWNCGIEVANE